MAKKKKKKVSKRKKWSPIPEPEFTYEPWTHKISRDSGGRPKPHDGPEFVQTIGHMVAIVDAAGEDKAEFFIQLNHGFKSSKVIAHYEDGSWEILNEIDGTYQEFDELEELLTETHVGEAIEKMAFVWTGTG